MFKTVSPGMLRGVFTPPSDKSISHRALMLSAIAQGTSTISNLLHSQDVLSTQACLRALGVAMHQDGDILRVNGLGGRLASSNRPLQCGNSGTTMRLLSGILAAQPFCSVLVGDASLSKRPMRRILTPLQQMGASVYSSPAGHAPVLLLGGSLHAIDYRLPVASAQLKSAILLAAVQANGKTIVHEPAPTRNHTELMLQQMGIRMNIEAGSISVSGPQVLRSTGLSIPGDFSSAAPFIVAAAITDGSAVRVTNVGLNPTRTGLLQVLRRMGASIEVMDRAGQEPVGDITVTAQQLFGVEIAAEEIPLMIDEVPLLVVAACLAKGKTIIRGAGELRLKESDRIDGITQPLLSMGARIQVDGDDIVILGPCSLSGGTVESRHDHRLAMALAVAGLNADNPVTVHGSEWVDISFPTFWEVLERLQGGQACDG